jgi:hypothetical protein
MYDYNEPADLLSAAGPQFCPDCDAEWSVGDHCAADCPGANDQPEDFIRRRADWFATASGKAAYFGIGETP